MRNYHDLYVAGFVSLKEYQTRWHSAFMAADSLDEVELLLSIEEH